VSLVMKGLFFFNFGAAHAGVLRMAARGCIQNLTTLKIFFTDCCTLLVAGFVEVAGKEECL
jgi:hypothetical protein